MRAVAFLVASITASILACPDGRASPLSLLHEASSAASQVVCTSTFAMKLDPDAAYRAQLQPEPGMWLVDWALRYDIDRAKQEVRTNIAGAFHTRSVYREGRGCTLVREGAAEPPALPTVSATRPLLGEIAGPATVAPASGALRATLDAAFAESGSSPPRATAAIVIVHDGRVIGERYAPGIRVDTPLSGHSLAKSVVNALIGALVREGRLDIRRRVAAPEWSAPNDPRSQITIEDLMRMRAGFDFDEGAGAGTATHMWYEEPDIAHFAASLPLATSPERRWHYSSASYALLSRVLGKAIGGGPKGLNDFAHREIFEKLGMRSATIEFDAAGNMMGAHAVLATARDWARFGLLYLNDGVIDGRRILPEGWVREARTPTAGSGYGSGFWLNVTNAPVPVWGFPFGLPGAPADSFMGRGYMGQWVVIVPSENLVVVRLGFSHCDAGEMMSVANLVRDTVRALHEPNARKATSS